MRSTTHLARNLDAVIAAIAAATGLPTEVGIETIDGSPSVTVKVGPGREVGIFDVDGWDEDEAGGTGAYLIETNNGEGYWEQIEGTATFLPTHDLDAMVAEVKRQADDAPTVMVPLAQLRTWLSFAAEQVRDASKQMETLPETSANRIADAVTRLTHVAAALNNA